jgi:TP901 family phage tail tape measure protein
MALDAGEVYAVLGGRFSPQGFVAFDNAMKKSHAGASAFEKRLDEAGHKSGTALRAKKSGNALRAIGKAALYTSVGVGAAAVGVGFMVKKAADFEQQMSSLGSVTNASGKQMAQFRAQALKAGADTKYSALQAAQAQTELAKGGLSVAQIMGGGLKAALALAAAGDLELADAATFTVNAMKLFGLHGRDSMKVADQLATAANATTADVKDFGMALTQGGTAAKSAGLDFTNTVAILEALASIGIKNSDAGTSLKTTLSQLASPTKKANGLMQEMGLHFFDSNGKMKDAVSISAMLRDKWSGLTHEQRLAAASTLAGTDGMRTLLALYQTGPDKLRRYEEGLQRQGSAAEVAAKKQDNLAGKIENLKGSVETSAIIIGSALLPMLTKGAEKLTDFLNAAAARGDIQRIGKDLAHGLEEGAQAIPTIIDGLQLIGHTIGFTVGAVHDLVEALGGIETVGPALLGAGIGLGGLRVASAVLPPIIGLARGLSDVSLALRAGGLAFAGETLLSLVNPATAAMVAVAGLGAAIALLVTRESYEEAVAKSVAAAKRDQANATNELRSAEDQSASATVAAQRAHLGVAQAHQRVVDVLKQYGRHSTEYKDALLAEKEAGLNWVQAHGRMLDEQKKLDNQQRNVSVKSTEDYTKALKRVDDAEKAVDASRRTGAGHADPVLVKRLAEAQKALAQITEQASRAQTRGAISAVDYARKLAGVGPIAEKNKNAVAQLTGVLNRVPAAKRTKLEADDQDVLAKLGRVVPRLISYGQMEKAAKILANSSSAEQALSRVNALLNSLHDRTINVQVNQHSSGGGAFGLNKPAKGHATGHKTSGPEIAMIGEDSPQWAEWVIPENPQYRGRAMGLLMDAMKSILPGYAGGTKKGKGKAKAHRHVPKARDPLSLPVDRFETDERNAQDRHDAAVRKVHDLEHQSALKGKTNADERAKARKALPGARKSRDDLAALLKTRKAELHDAKVYAGKISRQEDLAEIARNAMELADKHDDQPAFDTAQGKRKTALGALQGLYEEALKHVRNDTPYGRQLQKALGQTKLDINDAATAINAPEINADDPTVLTDAQQGQLDDIEKAIALDTVNTPTDTTDDIVDQGRLVSFWEGILGQLQADGAKSSFITEAANNVRSARDQLTSLTSSGSKDPDLQAQLDQANARAAASAESARISSKALEVFQGAGDIGLGPQTVIHVQTLHPGDPATLSAIGAAAASGLDLRTTKSAPREVSGL